MLFSQQRRKTDSKYLHKQNEKTRLPKKIIENSPPYEALNKALIKEQRVLNYLKMTNEIKPTAYYNSEKKTIKFCKKRAYNSFKTKESEEKVKSVNCQETSVTKNVLLDWPGVHKYVERSVLI